MSVSFEPPPPVPPPDEAVIVTLTILLDTFGELTVIVELPDDTPLNVTVCAIL